MASLNLTESESDFSKQETLPTATGPIPTARKIPEEIGPYKVEALLEKGGMSILYLATHPETKDQ